ncbi:hypothetical protein BBJ28_00019808 [Nothophytophthora sp. Chile5]|nr:hypothetical protein BBJ28_00019808 [Nothophytophthora sp. Chile5]
MEISDGSSLLAAVARGQLQPLPPSGHNGDQEEEEAQLLLGAAPFLPLFTRLQHTRRLARSVSPSAVDSTAIDRLLLRCDEATALREYAHVFASLSPADIEAEAIEAQAEEHKTASFRLFESGSPRSRATLVLLELRQWQSSGPDAVLHSELFANAIYQDELAAILAHTLRSSRLQQQSQVFGLTPIVRLCLSVPLGATVLTRLAMNDPSSVEDLLDALVAWVVDSTTTTGAATDPRKPMAQQEQEALSGATATQSYAQQACVALAQLTPLYAARLCERLSEQTTSLCCAALAIELLATCTTPKDASVFLYQWLKRGGAPGSALRTYMQLASRDAATGGSSSFQQTASGNLTKLRDVLLGTLSQTSPAVTPYELTTTLGVCVGLQVLGSFPLGDAERLQLLHSLNTLATSSSSARVVSLAFLVVVLVWYPLAPALSKAPGQRDEHTKNAVVLSQQALVTLFHARNAGAGPLFVVSAVLFYTKAPALVPFLSSVIGLDDGNGSSPAAAGGGGVRVQQALRAEYLHVFGDVVLKPVLTENLLAREVLVFPPAARVSALDATSSGHGQHELTLRGLHGLLCEKSFLRHHHAHRLENWLAVQVGEQAALPVHPLLVSLLLEWIENYVMAFEYPIAQAPRRLQLSIVPLRSATLTKWLSAACLARVFSNDDELTWARGVLGLTYALQFNQRLRHATMVAGSKLSSLVTTSSVASAASAAALGSSADICLHYDLSAFPLRNMLTQALAHGDQGGAFEYVAPTLLRLMMEEHPQLFDAATAVPVSSLPLLPLASPPRDVAESDLAASWFRHRCRRGDALDVRVVQSPVSWTAVHLRLLELQSAPINVVMRELPLLVDGFLPFAVLASSSSPTASPDVAAFCAQFATLYETRARREQGACAALEMRILHVLCFPDALWRQQQMQTQQREPLDFLTYQQVLEEPFRLVDDAHDGVFRQPALLRVLLGLVRDVRAAANEHVTKCDPSLVPMDSMAAMTGATAASVQQHRLLQDCLLAHGLIKRLLVLESEDVSDEEVAEENRALLCTMLNELFVEDAALSSPSPPRLLLAIHTQGYANALVPLLVTHVPVMKLLWEHWMTASPLPASTGAAPSSSRSTASPGTKALLEFVAEGAEKDLPKWRYRLRVVLSLCATYLSGSRQSSAMQQALRVVWNKLRSGIGGSGESGAAYVAVLGEVMPWIVEACAQNAELCAELVHFLLKLQKQQQGSSSSGKARDNRRTAEAMSKPQAQRQQLEQLLHDAYASLLQQL